MIHFNTNAALLVYTGIYFLQLIYIFQHLHFSSSFSSWILSYIFFLSSTTKIIDINNGKLVSQIHSLHLLSFQYVLLDVDIYIYASFKLNIFRSSVRSTTLVLIILILNFLLIWMIVPMNLLPGPDFTILNFQSYVLRWFWISFYMVGLVIGNTGGIGSLWVTSLYSIIPDLYLTTKHLWEGSFMGLCSCYGHLEVFCPKVFSSEKSGIFHQGNSRKYDRSFLKTKGITDWRVE